MYLKENIILAILGLRANKMRSLLTMLGIIIGISSVTAILSIGNALTDEMTQAMESMGANNIILYIWQKGDAPNAEETEVEDASRITDTQIDELKLAFPNEIEYVSAYYHLGYGSATEGRQYAGAAIQGVNEDSQFTDNIEVLNGRFLNEKDVKGTHRVAVISDVMARLMYPNQSPLGKELNITLANSIETYTIIGVYKYESSMLFNGPLPPDERDLMTSVYIPVTLAKENSKFKNHEEITIKTVSGVDSIMFSAKLEAYIDKIYNSNKQWTGYVYNMESMASTMTTMMSSVALAIAAIAAIALLVGGIGVMNIMLVSVTERTREIGTRKALGAKKSHIRTQFIVEAVIVCVIGGLIGIIFGVLTSLAACAALQMPASISITGMLVSVGFSMAIGVFFGYYPANKAAKLDAIDALRYE